MRLIQLYLVVLRVVPDLDLADMRFAVVEVVDLYFIENTRKAPEADRSRGRLPVLGDRYRGDHKSIIVLT